MGAYSKWTLGKEVALFYEKKKAITAPISIKTAHTRPCSDLFSSKASLF